MAETWQEILFWVLAVVMGISALRVVTTQNVVHAALYLVGTLMGAAALYVLLLAEFVAWVQVLIYVGAIVVLMLFGLMLTRAPIGKRTFDNNQRLAGGDRRAGRLRRDELDPDRRVRGPEGQPRRCGGHDR